MFVKYHESKSLELEDVVVCRSYSALSYTLGYQEEVKEFVAGDTCVYDSSCCWVDELGACF